MNLLVHHTPSKNKFLRANLENLEKIRKVITKRSQLKKTHWKTLKEKSLKAYKKKKEL